MTRVPPFLGEFSNEDAAWFVDVGVRRRVPAGEAIILEGELVTELFVILKGSFSVMSRGVQGMPEIHLGPGEIAGEMTFVRRDEPPLSSVRADEDSMVLCIPRTALDERLAADRGFAARFHTVVSRFTVTRLYGSWRPEVPKPDPPKPAEPSDPLERVYIMIRAMLPPEDGEKKGTGKRKPKTGDEGKGEKEGEDGGKKGRGKKDGGKGTKNEEDDDKRKPPPE